MNSLNIDAPLKVFLSDLTHFTKSDSSWKYNFPGSDVQGIISKIHIQGEISKTAGFNNEILIIDDGTGKAKVMKGAQVPGDLSWISSETSKNLSNLRGTIQILGVYCSVVGIVVSNGKLPQISAHKIAKINNKILQEMWPLEVTELKNVLLGKSLPKLAEL